MDITAIQALIASLKTAADVSKTLADLKSTTEVQGKVAELQSALLSAQNSALAATSAQFELQEKVRELETRLKAVDDWNATRSRYALVTPWRGPAQAYALKKSEADGDEPHFVCTKCFEERKRIILNPSRTGRNVHLKCPGCGASLDTGYSGIGSAEYAEEYLNSNGDK